MKQLDGMTLSSPSGDAQLALFAPYCGGLRREQALRRALERLPLGQFEGARARSDAQPHRYVLSWSAANAPLQACRCELRFQDRADQRYPFECPAHQLLDWLMQADEGGRQDLPDSFWQWLLLEQIADDGSP
ncbi:MULTISPECIES: type IV pilus biogenesis protein EbsA [unclassified Synechococcus]|uniref:type IV pilus biogenesis protein EbsA n=1 Tax=unclassified Synechococcus TaxID=2626047 RepID=UPI001E46B079|nr:MULTISPECIES: type IV pilus biogenesis protein EbsA [unclassified Synechococcus]